MPDNLLSPEYGLSNSKLEECTANPSDVMNGKTFYSGDKTLKTGTMKDTQSLAVTPMVLTHACMSLNQASLPSGDCNPNFITSSGWVILLSIHSREPATIESMPDLLYPGQEAAHVSLPLVLPSSMTMALEAVLLAPMTLHHIFLKVLPYLVHVRDLPIQIQDRQLWSFVSITKIELLPTIEEILI